MNKYIDAEVLENNIHKCTWVHDTKCVEKFVDSLPAADVQEVKQGRWIELSPPFRDIFSCSLCGRWGEYHWNYCPHCGAKMDLEGDIE